MGRQGHAGQRPLQLYQTAGAGGCGCGLEGNFYRERHKKRASRREMDAQIKNTLLQ